MTSQPHLTRYARQTSLAEFGFEGQKRLNEASVLIIGAGGIGCAVLPYLAAAGVGRLGIVDEDIVEEHNLQRQIIYGSSTLGHSKATAAQEYLFNLNPLVKVDPFPLRLNAQNASTIFPGFDLIIDCSDNFETRYIIDDGCRSLNKAWIYGAVHKYEGQIAIFYPQDNVSYRSLFPCQSVEKIPDCMETGVLGVLPGMTGLLQAIECIKLITGIGEPLVGKFLMFNLLTQHYQQYTFGKYQPSLPSPVCHVIPFPENNTTFELRESSRDSTIANGSISEYGPICDRLNPEALTRSNRMLFLGNGIKALSANEYNSNPEQYLLYDVREYHEMPSIPKAMRLPLSELLQRAHEIPQGQKIAFVCQCGIRSKQAAEILAKQNQFHTIYSIYEPLY